MRKYFQRVIIAIFGCIVSLSSFAQENEKTRIYEIRSNIPVFPCDLLGNLKQDPNQPFVVPPFKSKFAVSRGHGDSVIIRFLSWKVNTPLRNQFNDTIVQFTNSFNRDTAIKVVRYFLMSKNDLDSNCVKSFAKGWETTVFTIGLVTMPMKLRLGSNFDFQGNLSLGTTAGAKIRLSRYNNNYINFLFGASISTVSLDSFNTRGKLSGQPLTNIAVFSPSLGIVFEFGHAQAGIFYGWDLLNKSTQQKYGWIYDRKPWLSIGFGFSIFNVDSKANNPQSQTQ